MFSLPVIVYCFTAHACSINNCDCADCSNPNVFPKARFVSEFGVQSYPTYDTLRTALSRADSYVDSGNMYWRQRKFSDAPSTVFNWAGYNFRMAGDCEWLLHLSGLHPALASIAWPPVCMHEPGTALFTCLPHAWVHWGAPNS